MKTHGIERTMQMAMKIKRASAVDRIHNQSGTEWILVGDKQDLIDLVEVVKSIRPLNMESRMRIKEILDAVGPLADHFEIARKDQG